MQSRLRRERPLSKRIVKSEKFKFVIKIGFLLRIAELNLLHFSLLALSLIL
jgi:hypothetical protein